MSKYFLCHFILDKNDTLNTQQLTPLFNTRSKSICLFTFFFLNGFPTFIWTIEIFLFSNKNHSLFIHCGIPKNPSTLYLYIFSTFDLLLHPLPTLKLLCNRADHVWNTDIWSFFVEHFFLHLFHSCSQMTLNIAGRCVTIILVSARLSPFWILSTTHTHDNCLKIQMIFFEKLFNCE